MPAANETRASWRRNLVALLVMPFLALHFQALGEADVGAVAVWTGATLGVTPLVAALCAPMWGRVGDRFGEKLLIQRSLSSFVLVMVLMAAATEPWQLFALRAVQGLVAGYGALAIAMAARSAPGDKMASAIGWVQTAQRLGPACGPVIGGFLSPIVGLRNTFYVSAVAYGVAFALFSALYRDPPRAAVSKPVGEPLAMSSIFSLQHFVLLMIAIFVLQMVDRSLGPVLLLHVTALGYSPVAASRLVGVLFSVLALCGALGHHFATAALARWSAHAVIAGAALVGAGALGVFSGSDDEVVLIGALAVVGVSIGLATTTVFTAAGRVIPLESHGTSFGFLTGSSLVGSSAGAVVAGLVAGQGIQVVFVGAVIVLVGLAVIVARVMGSSRPLESSASADEY
jgi:MFS family permease